VAPTLLPFKGELRQLCVDSCHCVDEHTCISGIPGLWSPSAHHKQRSLSAPAVASGWLCCLLLESGWVSLHTSSCCCWCFSCRFLRGRTSQQVGADAPGSGSGCAVEPTGQLSAGTTTAASAPAQQPVSPGAAAFDPAAPDPAATALAQQQDPSASPTADPAGADSAQGAQAQHASLSRWAKALGSPCRAAATSHTPSCVHVGPT
jgi:hypothetical protein